MLMYIRKHRVHPNNFKLSLFKPIIMNYTQLGETAIPIIYGFNKRNKNECGVFVYHRGRLIQMYSRVGMQNSPDSRGLAVISVVNCDYLKPTHNKQDFILDPAYRLLMQNVATKLGQAWKFWFPFQGTLGWFFNKMSTQCQAGPFWIQCTSCFKWRRVPKPAPYYSDDWNCKLNEDGRYNSCESPEDLPVIYHDIRCWWAQCSKCSKWRRLPPANSYHLPSTWRCSDSKLPYYDKCKVPQESDMWAIELELGTLQVVEGVYKPRTLR
eukprot:TRINITY_DN3221_c0_g2_i2.p1 TRINITY_DN3221_c0_g2~~TRINITY_DN3221_c0_g2_i2.p1  ORF type:complete len:279 (-),score=46.94 TRINITY_DN3221_c0_g2_i2:12-812(-)